MSALSGPAVAVPPNYVAVLGTVSPTLSQALAAVPAFALPVVPAMPDGAPFGEATLPDPSTGSTRSIGAHQVNQAPNVASRVEAPRAPTLPTLAQLAIGGATA